MPAVMLREEKDTFLDDVTVAQLAQRMGVKERIFFFPQHHGGHAQRPAGQLALTLVDDIRGRDKTCLSLIHISTNPPLKTC